MERGLFWVVFCVTFAGSAAMGEKTKAPIHVKVGAILDMESLVGKMSWISISMAVEDFYSSNPNYTTRLVLHLKDAKSEVLLAGSAGLGLIIKDRVLAILGPQKTGQTRFLSNIADVAQVPLISFTTTSPLLSPSAKPYFLRTALDDSAQVDAIASIVASQGWREATIIHEDTEYGNDVVPFLVDALQSKSIRVPHKSRIPQTAPDDQILRELIALQVLETRVFIVHASLPVARRLVSKAKEARMVTKGYAWIMTDGISDLVDSVDRKLLKNMQGFLGVKPFVADSRLEDFTRRWQRKFRSEYPEAQRIQPSVFSLWAYDSVTALASAVEKVKVKKFHFRNPKTAEKSTDLDALVVSTSGPAILKAMEAVRFTGVAGEFRLVNGQLRSSTLEIINVVGNGHKRVGFWTPEKGLSSELGLDEGDNKLGAIVWPGDTVEVPKGWEATRGGKRLRVGFPLKYSFLEFVKYKEDPITQKKVPTGYCIDIFNSVMNSLPYSVPFDYFPFMLAPGAPVSYDLLLQQVSLNKFDAVVGDVTIMADRFKYVDFTLPYTGSDVYMIVPLTKDNKRESPFVFLEPLTKELWLCSLSFFFIIGFTLWGIEWMEGNEDFKGPPLQVFNNVLYLAFSTLVFAHRQEIKSYLSRVVVIMWIFAVLILSSTYTANLASILTTAKLKPAFADMKQVMKTQKHVGYSRQSYLRNMLQPVFGPNLVPLLGPNEFASALANGTVVAIFDELPYIRIFLKKYCKGYTMVGPTHRTAGFGFAFHKNSPLVRDVSKGLISLMQSSVMEDIERRWMSGNDTAECSPTSDSDNRITLHSLRGLFIIIGIASLVALAISFCQKTFHRRPSVFKPRKSMAIIDQREPWAVNGQYKEDAEKLNRNSLETSSHDAHGSRRGSMHDQDLRPITEEMSTP